MDVRCPGKKHAEVIEPAEGGLIDIKCDSRICGAGRGRVVIHRFTTATGALVATRTYRTPERT